MAVVANIVTVEFIYERFRPWPLTSSRKTVALLELFRNQKSVSLTKWFGCQILRHSWTQGLWAPKLSIPPRHFMGLRSEVSFARQLVRKTGGHYMPLWCLPLSQSLEMSASCDWSAKVSSNSSDKVSSNSSAKVSSNSSDKVSSHSSDKISSNSSDRVSSNSSDKVSSNSSDKVSSNSSQAGSCLV